MARALLVMLISLLLTGLPTGVSAQQLPAENTLAYLVDEQGDLTLQQAVARRAEWLTAPGQRVSTGFGAHTTWVSWPLPSADENAGVRMLQLDTGSARELTAWLVNRRGQVLRRFELGAARNFEQRLKPQTEFVVPIVSSRNITVIARIRSVEPMQFSPVLWPADTYRQVTAYQHAGHAIVAGIGVAMMLFGLMMFVSLREKAYLIFFAWIPVLLLLLSVESGLAFQWLWPEKPNGNNFAAIAAPALFGAVTALLTMNALELTANPPVWLRVVFQVSGMASLAMIATLTLIPWSIAIQLSWALCSVILFTSVLASLIRITQRARAAGGYLVGILAACAAVPGHWAIEMGWAPPLAHNELLLLGAGSFSIVAISVGLAQRLYSEERLSQHAQANLMKSHKAATARLEENVRARTFELEIANERLARVNRIDGLTGVFNRRHFDESIRDAVRNAISSGQPMAAMMIDLDFFKRLNDTYGHAAGDACLIEAAKRAEACVPETDGMIARYGGEEFVGLLSGTTPEQAQRVAEAIRASIEQAEVVHDGVSIRMTASLGLNCAVPDATGDPAAFLACADEALYVAKENGRNQVVCYDPATAERSASAPTPTNEASATAVGGQ